MCRSGLLRFLFVAVGGFFRSFPSLNWARAIPLTRVRSIVKHELYRMSCSLEASRRTNVYETTAHAPIEHLRSAQTLSRSAIPLFFSFLLSSSSSVAPDRHGSHPPTYHSLTIMAPADS